MNFCLFKRMIWFCLLVFMCNRIEAKIKLPAFFCDNMILQQQSEVVFEGKATPNVKISFIASWLEKKKFTSSDNLGNWKLTVKTPVAGGPYSILISDGDLHQIKNIYSGEVWLCAGQSNMEMPIKGYLSQPVLESNQIIAEIDSSIPIHLFTVQRDASKLLKEDVIGCWKENTGDAVADFSATAYFFGKELYSILKVPIGLINVSWGASNIESWLPSNLLSKRFPNISLEHLQQEENPKVPQQAASLLHNGMLYPLRKYKIKGAIWYQGEANRFRPKEYEDLFLSFVDYLRTLFNHVEMPFYYAQIAPFAYNDQSKQLSGALLRESQFNCEEKINHTGMAVLMDIGDSLCIHPAEKKTVGRRLAYWALKNDYHRKAVDPRSPRYVSQRIDGDKILLTFEHAEMGLTSFGKQLNCFQIAGEDRLFYQAKALLNGNKVVVWADEVKNPVSVRYAFENYAKGDLYGGNGLPVSSFRTNF